jgi:hypothetical protein
MASPSFYLVLTSSFSIRVIVYFCSDNFYYSLETIFSFYFWSFSLFWPRIFYSISSSFSLDFSCSSFFILIINSLLFAVFSFKFCESLSYFFNFSFSMLNLQISWLNPLDSTFFWVEEEFWNFSITSLYSLILFLKSCNSRSFSSLLSIIMSPSYESWLFIVN